MQQESIKIRPSANNHGLFLIMVSALLFIITLSLAEAYWQQWRLVFIALYLISVVILFTGVLKKIQPQYSFLLTKEKLIFQHRVGQWQLLWSQIRYMAPLTSTRGIDVQTLPYIGIKLTDRSALEQCISNRLASRLIHEQRPLLIWALSHQLITLEESLINFSPYKGNKQLIKGPKAAFLHQVITLEKAFGFHLFIHQSSLDREISEFCHLLKQCRTYAADHANSKPIPTVK